MSIKVMTDVWAHADCKGSELLLLLALADFSDDNGENIYPSMQTLAAKTRLSEPQARRIVQRLVEMDLIEIVETGGWQHGRNRSNTYRIKLEVILRGIKMIPPPPRASDTTVVAPTREDPSYKYISSRKRERKKYSELPTDEPRRNYQPDDD